MDVGPPDAPAATRLALADLPERQRLASPECPAARDHRADRFAAHEATELATGAADLPARRCARPAASRLARSSTTSRWRRLGAVCDLADLLYASKLHIPFDVQTEFYRIRGADGSTTRRGAAAWLRGGRVDWTRSASSSASTSTSRWAISTTSSSSTCGTSTGRSSSASASGDSSRSRSTCPGRCSSGSRRTTPPTSTCIGQLAADGRVELLLVRLLRARARRAAARGSAGTAGMDARSDSATVRRRARRDVAHRAGLGARPRRRSGNGGRAVRARGRPAFPRQRLRAGRAARAVLDRERRQAARVVPDRRTPALSRAVSTARRRPPPTSGSSRAAGRRLAVLVDDGEKFGGWPGTKEWVYERGWLSQFLDAMTAAADNRAGATLARSRRRSQRCPRAASRICRRRPTGRWRPGRSRPSGCPPGWRAGTRPRCGAPRRSGWRPDSRCAIGAISSSSIPSRTACTRRCRPSRTLCRARGRSADRAPGDRAGRSATTHTGTACSVASICRTCARHCGATSPWRSANCGRGNRSRSRPVDFDGDGSEELWVHSARFSAIVSPRRGGAIEEYTVFKGEVNYADVLTRRREAYHETRGRDASGSEPVPGQAAPSIHDIEKGVRLERLPPVDAHDRAILVDRRTGRPPLQGGLCGRRVPGRSRPRPARRSPPTYSAPETPWRSSAGRREETRWRGIVARSGSGSPRTGRLPQGLRWNPAAFPRGRSDAPEISLAHPLELRYTPAADVVVLSDRDDVEVGAPPGRDGARAVADARWPVALGEARVDVTPG